MCLHVPKTGPEISLFYMGEKPEKVAGFGGKGVRVGGGG